MGPVDILFSLCILSVLCVSVVVLFQVIHHKGTSENTEDAQRGQYFLLACVTIRGINALPSAIAVNRSGKEVLLTDQTRNGK
jgi:hypothetical protein